MVGGVGRDPLTFLEADTVHPKNNCHDDSHATTGVFEPPFGVRDERIRLLHDCLDYNRGPIPDTSPMWGASSGVKI